MDRTQGKVASQETEAEHFVMEVWLGPMIVEGLNDAAEKGVEPGKNVHLVAAYVAENLA